MRHFHVTVFYIHCAGVNWVPPSESDITFVRAYGVNNVLVDTDWAELRFAPFGEIALRKLPADQRDRHPMFVEPYQRLWDSLTADDWLDSSTSESKVVPVSTIEFRDAIEGTYVELMDQLRVPPKLVSA